MITSFKIFRDPYKINDRWGEFVITPALMMGMQDVILDRIAFGA